MKKIGMYIAIGLFFFLGFKSCFVSPVDIDDYIALERMDKSGQKYRVILTPKEEMIYIKNYRDVREVGIYKIKGEGATHYLLDLYLIGRFPFGLRYYSNAEKVFNSNLILTKKFGDSFPEIGKTFNSKIVIFEDRVIIGRKKYNRNKNLENNESVLKNISKQIKSKI